MIAVVMGVSGSGKSTVGRALARRLGATFLDADDYHPAANIEKMKRGRPLDDRDRSPWLAAVARAVRAARRTRKGPVVVACSALRRRYRASLIRRLGPIRLIYLNAPPRLVAERLKARTGHFMPAALLDSQIAALEKPSRACAIDAALPVATVVSRAMRRLRPKRT